MLGCRQGINSGNVESGFAEERKIVNFNFEVRRVHDASPIYDSSSIQVDCHNKSREAASLPVSSVVRPVHQVMGTAL